MAVYKNKLEKKLNQYQFDKLNLIENVEIRKSSISLLSYMMIINDKKNAEYQEHQLSFLEKEANELTISFGGLRTLYIKNHKKLSLTTLKERIYKLVELNLLKITKIKNKNKYTFLTEATIVPTVVTTDENNSEIIDNTEVTSTDACCVSLDYGTTTKDLDSNRNDGVNYDSYIESERKVCEWDIVCNKLHNLFKALKVKSPWIKERVTSKLEKYHLTITAKHLDSYICKMISNARADYYKNYNKYIKDNKTAETAPKLRFNNFEARTYDYDSLEKNLLGWEKSEEYALPIR